MRVICSLVLMAIVSVGCATKEGIRLPSGSGPTKENVQDFVTRNSAPPTPPATAAALPKGVVVSALVPAPDGPRLIVIGNVMALTLFDDATLGQRYDNYLKQTQARSGTATFTREWYLGTGAGETAVKFSGVTGVYTRFFKAEIPKDLVRQISFASGFGSFMAGTSGDLVSAERSAKLGTWITRVLCSEKQSDYDTCEAQYSRGLYQSVDGKEIDDKLQLIASGKVIDPATYRSVPASTTGNSMAPSAASVPAPSPPSAASASPPSKDILTRPINSA